MQLAKPSFRALSYVLLAFIMSGCGMGGGNIWEGKYSSPLDNFSLTVPSGIGMKVTDRGDDNGGMVSFHDDFGNLKAVTYMRLPASVTKGLNDPAQRDASYRGYLHSGILPKMFKRVSPNSKVLHEEFLNDDKDREYLAVVDIPGGSPLVEMNSGKRLDSTRALLIFETAGFMYALQDEIRGAFQQNDKFSLDEKRLEAARDSLHHFKKTIEFR
jgi:hypothetical protein